MAIYEIYDGLKDIKRKMNKLETKQEKYARKAVNC